MILYFTPLVASACIKTPTSSSVTRLSVLSVSVVPLLSVVAVAVVKPKSEALNGLTLVTCSFVALSLYVPPLFPK